VQGAIQETCKTPEVIRMFAKKQPEQLRTRLQGLERDRKLGKLPEEAFKAQSAEIVLALEKLGEKVTFFLRETWFEKTRVTKL
jgi:hypothetical protein